MTWTSELRMEFVKHGLGREQHLIVLHVVKQEDKSGEICTNAETVTSFQECSQQNKVDASTRLTTNH